MWLWPARYLFNILIEDWGQLSTACIQKREFSLGFLLGELPPEEARHPCIPATAAAGGKAGDADHGGALHRGFTRERLEIRRTSVAFCRKQDPCSMQRMGCSNSPAQQREALLVQLSATAESSGAGLM